MTYYYEKVFHHSGRRRDKITATCDWAERKVDHTLRIYQIVTKRSVTACTSLTRRIVFYLHDCVQPTFIQPGWYRVRLEKYVRHE